MNDLIALDKPDEAIKTMILEAKLSAYPPNTQSVYKTAIRHYVAFAEANGLPLGNPETIKAYIASLTLHASSVEVKLRGIKVCLLEAATALCTAREVEILRSALSTIKAPTVNRGDRTVTESDVLTALEVNQLIEAASIRTQVLITFLYQSGARISEALNIRLDDISPHNGSGYAIKILGKGNKERTLRVSRDLIELIKGIYHGSTYLFETKGGKPLSRIYATNEIKKAANQAGITKQVHAHTLRHSFATRMIKETKKIKAVSKYLGHASTSTTIDYYNHETLEDGELYQTKGGK